MPRNFVNAFKRRVECVRLQYRRFHMDCACEGSGVRALLSRGDLRKKVVRLLKGTDALLTMHSAPYGSEIITRRELADSRYACTPRLVNMADATIRLAEAR